MPIKDFTEKEIRSKIINKIDPVIKKRRSPHDKGHIEINGRIVARVKIPNNHDRIMKHSKSQYIASSLKIKEQDFNDLIDCPLSGPQYYSKLKEQLQK